MPIASGIDRLRVLDRPSQATLAKDLEAWRIAARSALALPLVLARMATRERPQI